METEKNINNAIIKALKEDNIEKLRHFYKEGYDLNYIDENGNNFIYYAFLFKAKQCSLFLIEHDADLFNKNDKKEVPIYILYEFYISKANDPEIQKIIQKVRNYTKVKNLENIISNMIFKTLRAKYFDYLEVVKFLFLLIDINENKGVTNYSMEENKIIYYSFLSLCYLLDNEDFFKLLNEINYSFDQKEISQIKKCSILNNNTKWIALLNGKKSYDVNSKEVICLVEEMFS